MLAVVAIPPASQHASVRRANARQQECLRARVPSVICPDLLVTHQRARSWRKSRNRTTSSTPPTTTQPHHRKNVVRHPHRRVHRQPPCTCWPLLRPLAAGMLTPRLARHHRPRRRRPQVPREVRPQGQRRHPRRGQAPPHLPGDCQEPRRHVRRWRRCPERCPRCFGKCCEMVVVESGAPGLGARAAPGDGDAQ